MDAIIRVTLLKSEGDFFKSIAEVFTGFARNMAADRALEYYKEAYGISISMLKPNNVLRLKLMINFSKFYYEILHDIKKALKITRKAISDNWSEYENLDSDEIGDTLEDSLMIELGENLDVWFDEYDAAKKKAQADNLEEENLEGDDLQRNNLDGDHLEDGLQGETKQEDGLQKDG